MVSGFNQKTIDFVENTFNETTFSLFFSYFYEYGWYPIFDVLTAPESSNSSSYLLMSMQDLCLTLHQDDPKEIRAIMEVMLTKLLNELIEDKDKKNVLFLHGPNS